MESGSMPSDNVLNSGRKRDYNEYESSSRRTEESRKIQELETRLEAITKVDGWRLEQLKVLEEEKRAVEKTLEDERQLFAEISHNQVSQNTVQIQSLQQHWMTLLKSSTANMPTFQQPDQCYASSVSKLERALDGMRQQLKLRSDERDKWKAKSNKLEEEAHAAQLQMKQLTEEMQRQKVKESARLSSNAQSAGNEEVCRDLLEQLEQRNLELQRFMKIESLRQAEFRRQIHKRDEEIRELKRIMKSHNSNKTEVTECIVCMEEFGEEPDRQRAHWKDCNHANVCYKCTHTLWNSKQRKCPSCNTPASSMPSRLPPNIYL